jgi:hypothetical protein
LKRPLCDPRELLARWAREDALGALDHALPPSRESTAETRPQLRFDGSHTALNPQTPVVERAAGRTPQSAVPSPPVAAESLRQEAVVHPPHMFNPPHIPLPLAPVPDKSSKWVTLTGQLFAYAGVGGLTVGTVLVLMGYFGGPSTYATTGWLITTAGQMLLFLGVITLVAGGMEQTTLEVARRIDVLGDRLIRIEQATQSGPPDPHHRARPQAAAGGRVEEFKSGRVQE